MQTSIQTQNLEFKLLLESIEAIIKDLVPQLQQVSSFQLTQVKG